MDWIHCNNCSKTKSDHPNCVFYVTNCFHIMCQTCIQNVCYICKKPFRATIINNSMPYNVKYYFGNLQTLAENFQRAIKFQFEHRYLYENRTAKKFLQMNKISDMKREMQKQEKHCLEEYKKQCERFEKLKNICIQIKMHRQRKLKRLEFMKTLNDFRSQSKHQDKSFESYSASENKSFSPRSSYTGSRSFTPSTLTIDFNKNQSSLSAKRNYPEKIFYITPRNTYITKDFQASTNNRQMSTSYQQNQMQSSTYSKPKYVVDNLRNTFKFFK